MKALVLIAMTSASCAGFIEDRAAATTFGVLEKSQIAAKRQSDVELARAAVPGGLLQLEAFALAYPAHRGFKTLHAEALCQFAAAFVFDDWEHAKLTSSADADRLAERVVRLGAQCTEANLALLSKDWRAARIAGETAWAERLAKATRAETGPLRWIATSDALALALAPLARIGTLPTIDATLRRVIALAPGEHDSDAELLLGTLEAGRSAFLGGPNGQELFDRARAQLGPGALLAEVMYVRGVAVATKDRALFTQTLERVLAADLDAWPDRRLANELARVKAKRYLAAIDVLIPE
ncbi:MAG: TRAP transporter TatT component family protein [Kofleriaceae bacterium]